MGHLIQKTYILERINGRIGNPGLFPECEIAARLTPLQKQMLAEEVIRKYLVYMEADIQQEHVNDTYQEQIYPFRKLLEHAGIQIQIIEKI